MTAHTTTKSIRYHVVDPSGTVLDVFLQKNNAVAKAVALALQYQSDTFYVVKKSLKKELTILEISLSAKFAFSDALAVFEGIELAGVSQKRKIAGVYKKENWHP